MSKKVRVRDELRYQDGLPNEIEPGASRLVILAWRHNHLTGADIRS